MAAEIITIEVAYGPAFRTALDVLEFVSDLADAIPDYDPAKQELLARADALREVCIENLRTRP
jgi:hypothetical protein